MGSCRAVEPKVRLKRGNIPPEIRNDATRRGAGVAERAFLLRKCTFTGTEGSNPSLSAIKKSGQPAWFFDGGLDFVTIFSTILSCLFPFDRI